MQQVTTIGVALVLALGWMSTPAMRAQGTPAAPAEAIPVDQEPRHRIVFADSRLRVLQVAIAANDTTLEHLHSHDLLTVNIENGPTRTRNRGADWGPLRPRQVGDVTVNEYTGTPVAHVVQSIGAPAYRLTGVENTRDGGWTSLPAVAGPFLSLLTESRAFRAYELTLLADAASTHAHPVPVVVVLVDGAARAGSGAMLTTAGAWALAEPGTAHSVTAGAAGARLVEIEVR